jgi:hypothetical protein
LSVQDIAAFAEIVGAIAVVISLVYLATQIRQNTKQIEENTNAVRASAVHASLSYAFDNRVAMFTDEGTATIYSKGLKDPELLDEIELLRFRPIMANIFDAILNMHAQTEITGFSPENWEAKFNTANRVLKTKGGTWYWDSFKDEYPKQFQNAIESSSEARA